MDSLPPVEPLPQTCVVEAVGAFAAVNMRYSGYTSTQVRTILRRSLTPSRAEIILEYAYTLPEDANPEREAATAGMVFGMSCMKRLCR